MKTLIITAAISAASLAHCGDCISASTTQDAGLLPSDCLSVEAGVKIDSKYLSYGFVDNDEPILTPSAKISFADRFSVGLDAIFDVTDYGRKAGYTNRAGKYTELVPCVEYCSSLSPDDVSWLPTTIEYALAYCYEYHPDAMGCDDTQFVSLEVGFPDLWIEPVLYVERDIDRDNGTYLNLELGHAFSLIEGDAEEDEPVLALRPSIAQGFGNSKRVAGYACCEDGEPLDHAGLMDTVLKLELTWCPCGNLAVSGFVAYSDFLFDSQIRQASRRYEAHGRWDESFNFIGGISACVSF